MRQEKKSDGTPNSLGLNFYRHEFNSQDACYIPTLKGCSAFILMQFPAASSLYNSLKPHRIHNAEPLGYGTGKAIV